MFTTRHASLAIALKQGRIKQQYSVKTYLTCIILVFAALMNGSPANARLWTTLSGTQVTITANSTFEPATIVGGCDGEIEFSYLQRVIINGQTAMVATEFVYAPGNYTFVFGSTVRGLLPLWGRNLCMYNNRF